MTNKERFEIKDERHFARIESYRERLEKGVDLFTGEPLRGEDLEGWKAATFSSRRLRPSFLSAAALFSTRCVMLCICIS